MKRSNGKTARNLKGLDSFYAFVLTGTRLENRIDELYSLAYRTYRLVNNRPHASRVVDCL